MLSASFSCWAHSLDFLFFMPQLPLCEKTVLRAVLESAATSRLREQVRNKHKAVTMLSRSLWAALAYQFHRAKLPPLNFSLQSAAYHQRDGVGMAHGRLRRGVCCQLAILLAGGLRGRGRWWIPEQDQQINQ